MRFGDLRIGLSRLAPFAAGVCLAATALTLATGTAQARRHFRHFAHAHSAPAGSPAPVEVDASKFSAIVVDANTGREIYGANENALRHPASITKVMTLYLLFEQLEKGKVSLSSRIPVSEHAASQEPSKLGVPAGESISVEDAIKAIVTRSANDMAVAVAEYIGGSESDFAQLMTHKAHQIGMSRTLYRNASGLPNDEQWTTARDLSLLGRSMQERFPTYFRYFSMHEFTYDGEVIGNHNHLLGRVEGVDGIKTGYTRASGFNLLTSVHRDGRALVAVVMGGRSAPARDRLMERLIETHIADASTAHTATRLAESTPENFAPGGRGGFARPVALAEREEVADAEDHEPVGQGDDSEEEARPVPPAPIKRLAAATQPNSPSLTKAAALDPAKLGWKTGPKAVAAKPAAKKDEGETRVARAAQDDDDDDDSPAKTKPGHWMIQVGATDDPDDARDLLNKAKRGNRSLAGARGFTEKVRKDGDTLYRVRFAGLDSALAEKACRDLKHSGLKCFTTQD